MAGKDRKKELARQRVERQRARREAEAKAARKRSVIGGAVATAVVILGVAGVAWWVTKDDSTVEPAAAAPSAAPGECLYTEAGEASKEVSVPPAKPAYETAVNASVKTSVGDLTFSLDGAKAPCTVNSFAHLAAEGYFDDTECHRLTENVLQCGDPSATGSGGPGYQFANENTEGAVYKKGVLAMANAGADTNGSQFFIVYKDWDDLPPDYTVFGTVTKGLEEVEKVGKAGSEPAGDGKPKTKVEIKSISIEKN
ncbi:peptidyl-prolyl cis-trans isomerase B (cyclophilin B) [Actinocorallia herbida]|uniref:Peptidyl-prolyl cis-trans isomerase n=1 Tax=Actinocorallia herbida TaxID=58109 RepID=A0A3N1CST4_9ACTN|nr:peptidylprolyl isomerase [Actinocorallia herbida]ROO84386.1 peptidyl-prolyl cis-trans isomerase B (cyclophilin B) [Actinocorallia herbida]